MIPLPGTFRVRGRGAEAAYSLGRKQQEEAAAGDAVARSAASQSFMTCCLGLRFAPPQALCFRPLRGLTDHRIRRSSMLILTTHAVGAVNLIF